MKSVKLISLGLLLVTMGTVLVGCSIENKSSSADYATSSSVAESATSSSSASSKAETESSKRESSSESSQSAKSQASSSSASSASAASSATASSTQESASMASSQSQPAPIQIPSRSGASTAGDQRVWGSRRTKRYYTPAQNYRGFRPHNAVPFENEAAAQAAGYTQASRRSR
ncbi:hypothetical protein ACFQH1_11295 [Lactiplantibacillus daoliensis]|uniref:Lipoprotein n=1 Tax=Lactiplantibacillus daoliensis TaxID=2559916 RepID=A0ABW1UKM2_9LACO|nr:hypothetical protein [Lactiplantibacillus daoliensis]